MGKSNIKEIHIEKGDDYSLEEVPDQARRGWFSLANVTLGVATAMFFMQVTAQLSLSYGSINAILTSVYATLITGILAMGIAFFSAKTGLNANLMTRGAGYGVTGAAFTSIILAVNFIIYLSIEGSIMAHAIHSYIPSVPVWVFMIVVTIGIIPLNWYGISQLEKLQKYSLPIYVVLLGIGIVIAANMDIPYTENWLTFSPEGSAVGGVALLICIGTINGVVGSQTLLTSDYARFIKKDELKLGSFAVGFLPQLFAFFIMGLIGTWFGVRFAESNPGVYMVTVMGVWGALFTILTQIRINIVNLSSSSLALTNFFARLFNFRPGRIFWVVMTALIALTAMLLGIIENLEIILTFMGVFLFSWVASLYADLLVVKKALKLGPTEIEYRESHLPPWNPVGPISLIVASTVGALLAYGFAGPIFSAISAFIAGIISFSLHVMLAIFTKGKFYTLYAEKNVSIKSKSSKAQ